MVTEAPTCVLLPEKPFGMSAALGFVAPKRSTCRCLFGPPDPKETRRLVQEDLQANRDRLLANFGIDILAAVAIAREEDEQKKRRQRLCPYQRQSTLKDFFRVSKTKSVNNIGKDSSIAPENVVRQEIIAD